MWLTPDPTVTPPRARKLLLRMSKVAEVGGVLVLVRVMPELLLAGELTTPPLMRMLPERELRSPPRATVLPPFFSGPTVETRFALRVADGKWEAGPASRTGSGAGSGPGPSGLSHFPAQSRPTRAPCAWPRTYP